MDLYDEQNNEFCDHAYVFVRETFNEAVQIAMLPFIEVMQYFVTCIDVIFIGVSITTILLLHCI